MSEIAKTPETIEQLLRWSTDFLTKKGFSSARLDTELMLGHALKLRRIDLYLRFDQPLSRRELADFKTLLLRRLQHEPIAYIIGSREFMSLSFAVDARVLIPRSETELLVERAIAFGKSLAKDLRILEIGVGSGCIGLSLLHYLPGSSLVAWDLSPAAIELCKFNAQAHSILETRIEFKCADALDELNWKHLDKFDIIISNPPYIANHERECLSRSVIDFEPELALFGGEEGLVFYERFAKTAHAHLHPGGRLFVEIGKDQGQSVLALLESHQWRDITVLKDYSKHDRIVEGSYD